MTARLVVVAAAVVAFVLLAGGLRTARDIERGAALVERGERVDEALGLLRGAAGRTADATPLLRAAELQLFAGRNEAALADARSVARREPRNARAWLVIAQAAGRLGDSAGETAARERLAELVASP